MQGKGRDSKHGPDTHLSPDFLRVTGDKVLAIAKPGTGLASHIGRRCPHMSRERNMPLAVSAFGYIRALGCIALRELA